MTKIKLQQLTEGQISDRGIRNWPIWEKEISTFDWYYDGPEECLFLEGEVIVDTPEGNVFIKAGDFVRFEQGLKCTWKVIKPVRKHYFFP